MEIVAVADSQTVVDRQDQVTATRQVLVQCVCVCVVVRVVPTEKHLSRWATVNIDDRGLLRAAAARFKQLPMNLNSIGRFVDYLLWHHELRRWKTTWNAIFRERYRLACFVAARRHDSRQWWTLCGCAEVGDVLAIAGDERCPLESFPGSHDDRFRAVH